MESRAKPGTRPKGDRRAITVRVPRSQWAIFDGARKRAGYQSLSDYVTALLAEHQMGVQPIIDHHRHRQHRVHHGVMPPPLLGGYVGRRLRLRKAAVASTNPRVPDSESGFSRRALRRVPPR